MREIRQQECIQAISSKGYNCYIEACVGFGKTVMSQRVLYRMFKEGLLEKGARVLFQTSSTNLLNAFLEEAKLCEELFEFNITDIFNITTACYQSRLTTKESFDYVINDEFDFCGTVYAEDLSNYKGKMLCMSGTVDALNKFEFKGEEITKVEWIERKLPLAYTYSIEQGIKDKIIVSFETTLLYHELSPTLKYGKIWKNQKWDMTEREYFNKAVEYANKYRFFNEEVTRKELEEKVKTVNPNRIRDKKVLSKLSRMFFKEAYVEGKLEVEKANFTRMRNMYGKKATDLIQSTPSKLNSLRQFINKLEGRTIIWANRLSYLEKLIGAEYVYTPDNDVLKNFNDLKFNRIGTSKGILRGTTPTLVDNLVMVVPMGSATSLEQLIGRVIRTDIRVNKVAHLYICVTKDTYAENWLRRGCKKSNGFIDLNIKKIIYI